MALIWVKIPFFSQSRLLTLPLYDLPKAMDIGLCGHEPRPIWAPVPVGPPWAPTEPGLGFNWVLESTRVRVGTRLGPWSGLNPSGLKWDGAHVHTTRKSWPDYYEIRVIVFYYAYYKLLQVIRVLRLLRDYYAAITSITGLLRLLRDYYTSITRLLHTYFVWNSALNTANKFFI